MILRDLHASPPYQVILADPPWAYSGDPNKDQAAGKHYALLSTEDIVSTVPMRTLLAKEGVLYLWATSPKLDQAFRCGEAWGLRYIGVAFVWVKTTKEGKIIHGQGVRPTVTKPTTELVLAFSYTKRGRPLPILDESVGQVVTAPRGRHSEKPSEVMRRIELLHGDVRRLELFARSERPEWDAWGNEVE